MRRVQRFHALSVFGDMKPHRYTDAIMLGTLHFANPQKRMEIWGSEKVPTGQYHSTHFENLIKKLINDGLLALVENDYIRKLKLQNCDHKSHPAESGICIGWQVSVRDYDVILTAKGRDCLGLEQIARDGDYSFYKKFDGSIDSAQKLNPGLFKGRGNN